MPLSQEKPQATPWIPDHPPPRRDRDEGAHALPSGLMGTTLAFRGPIKSLEHSHAVGHVTRRKGHHPGGSGAHVPSLGAAAPPHPHFPCQCQRPPANSEHLLCVARAGPSLCLWHQGEDSGASPGGPRAPYLVGLWDTGGGLGNGEVWTRVQVARRPLTDK